MYQYADSISEIPLVEAYVVPPLAAVHPKPSSTVSSSLDETVAHPVSTGGFRDIWAAVLFIIQLLVVLLLAVQGLSSLKTVPTGPLSSSLQLTPSLLLTAVLFFLTTTTVASVAGSSVLYLVVHNAEEVIHWMLYANIATTAVMGILSLLALQPLGCLLFFAWTFVNYCYMRSVQDRIPFASALLQSACAALKPHFTALLLVGAACLVSQLAYTIIWSLAAVFVHSTYLQKERDAAYDASPDSDSSFDLNSQFLGYWLLLVLALYWSLQVAHYVFSTTTGGSVACWYFQPRHPAPVKASLFRASSYSFGSICFGALLISLVQTLRYLVDMLKRRQGSRDRSRRAESELSLLAVCFLFALDLFLRCVEGALRYISKYATAYVAAYGYDFLTSGKHALNLFERRGWTALINDNLIAYTLFLLTFGVALVGGITGAIALPALAFLLLPGQPPAGGAAVQLLGAGLLLGVVQAIVVGSMLLQMVEAAVTMLFVCFAEDPAALQVFHPDEHAVLVRAWRQFDASSLAWYTGDESAPDTTHGTEQQLEMHRLLPHSRYLEQEEEDRQRQRQRQAERNPPAFNPHRS